MPISVISILMGLIFVTLIATLGAKASRKHKFNYSLLTPVSIIIYILTAYFSSLYTTLFISLISTFIVTIYDAIIGWKLCKKNKANFGLLMKETDEVSLLSRIAGAIVMSLLFGYFGYYLSTS
jgi:hypothetical protein